MRLVRVFVSSPGDVQEERRVLEEVVDSVNGDVGERHSVFLKLFRWEKDVVPRIGPAPQEVVDAQAPYCDIFLGIMSGRFGTRTGKWGSGTEHEFRQAVERWGRSDSPWILFYFDDEPPTPKTRDAAMQFAKVLEFREELKKLGITGSYKGVQGDRSSFAWQAGEHLRRIVLNHLPPIESGEGAGAKRPAPGHMVEAGLKPPAVPKAYRDWLCSQCSEIGLLGLELKQSHAVRLSHVYVPLCTHAVSEKKRGERSRREDERFLTDMPGREAKPRLLLDLLGKESLYVPGAPGAGKSTFCRWVAWLVCNADMPSYITEAADTPEGYAESFPSAFGGRLPVLIRLREFWEYLPRSPGRCEMTKDELDRAIGEWFENKTPKGIEWTGGSGRADLATHMEQGSAILILDGADEVPLSGEEKRPCSPRAMLLSGLASAVPSWMKTGNRVLLTSRPYGLGTRESETLGLRQAPIVELDPDLQNLLIIRWFAILEGDSATGEEVAREMITHIRGRNDIDPLASNPMLLTAMCVIYGEGKRLPQDKHDLYTRIVNNVLYNRFHRDPTLIDPVRNRLAVVAHGMHTGEALEEDRTAPQVEATNEEIDIILRDYQDNVPFTESAFVDAVQAREQLLAESGLLLPRGEGRAGFYHLSFQEFLAAQRLMELDAARLREVFRERAETSEWRNTLSFLFSSRLAGSVSPEGSTRLLAELLSEVSVEKLGLHVVVADCFQILLGKGIRLPEALEEKFRKDCLSAIKAEVSIPERVHLGLVLGQIGHPRIVTDLRDRAAYVEVPPKRYFVGEKRKRFDLKESFLLSRYPVTNGQYAVFVEEEGYKDRKWWSDEGWKWRESEDVREPGYWHDRTWNGPTQPVVGVSFYEAEAFARWAGGRLPAEREWEAAARGPEGYVYPWGDDWEEGICNSDESGVGATTPVGLFPRSRSAPFELEDMSGNVWEWCSDYYDPTGSPGARVLRGGSWIYGSRGLRAAIRLRGVPVLRVVSIGFRVVL